jgi:Phosphotransferase enzyme family
MSEFRTFLDETFDGAQIKELSGSNNTVYLVRTGAGEVVAKHVTDTDIPLTYLAAASARLAGHIPVQRILRVYETERGDPFDAVIAEYVEGHDLATVLSGAAGVAPPADLAGYFCRFLAACRELPRMHDGFGLYKRGAAAIPTHPEFVRYYANRYWSRVRPFYAGTPVVAAVDDWIATGFEAAAGRVADAYPVVPVDANLKNFILTPDGRVVLLNVPIAARSLPAHAVAAVSIHLRNRPYHEEFLRAAGTGPDAVALDLVPHFEMWTMLGILSFHAVRDPRRPREWRNWGAPAPLYEDFRGLVARHLLGSGAR